MSQQLDKKEMAERYSKMLENIRRIPNFDKPIHTEVEYNRFLDVVATSSGLGVEKVDQLLGGFERFYQSG